VLGKNGTRSRTTAADVKRQKAKKEKTKGYREKKKSVWETAERERGGRIGRENT